MDKKEKENHLSTSPNKAKVKVNQLQEEKWIQPKRSGTVRVGDHSIACRSLLDVTGRQLPELRYVEESSAFSTLYSRMAGNSIMCNFDNVTHGYDISSSAIRPLGLSKAYIYFETHWSVAASARPTAVMIPSPVITNFSVSQGLVPDIILDLVKKRGVVNSEIFESRAAMWTHVVRSSHNLQVLSSITFMWQYCLELCDMSALYGKIIFYMFIKQRFQDEAIEPIRRAYSADDNIVWVNIKADISQATFKNQINEGQVVLCSWHGYSQSEINMMRIIQSAEPFYSNHGPQEAQRKIPGVAFTMPKIPIVFMGNGEDTANVPRATPNPKPHEWWQFALKIATARHEEDYLVTGLYLALELAFAHAIPKTTEVPPPAPKQEPLPDDATPAQIRERARLDEEAAYAAIDHHVPASVYLERGSIMWPLPRDINIIYRCADEYLRKPAIPKELSTLASISRHDLQLIAALIGAAISVMTATVLYGVNITGTEVEQWISKINVPERLRKFMEYGFAECLGMHAPLKRTIMMPIYIQVHKLLEKCGGIIPSCQAVRGRAWNYIPNAALATRDPTHYYFSSSPNAPPRNGNVLAIDNVLVMRPLEWGLGGSYPSVSLYENFTCNTAEGFIQQWQASLGDTTYDMIGATEAPYKLIPYGTCAITAICQQWFAPTPARPHLIINWAGKSTYDTRGAMWRNIERPQPEWSEALGCPEPLTIMTYNWNSDDLLSIIIDAPQFSESAWLEMLKSKNLSLPAFPRRIKNFLIYPY